MKNIYLACASANYPRLKELLEGGADPNERFRRGQTTLFAAIERDDIEFVKLLLAYGANPNIADITGCTPLHKIAAERPISNFTVEKIQTLLAAGADANSRCPSYFNRTAIQIIFQKRSILNDVNTVQIIELFKKYRADFDIKDDLGERLIDYKGLTDEEKNAINRPDSYGENNIEIIIPNHGGGRKRKTRKNKSIRRKSKSRRRLH